MRSRAVVDVVGVCEGFGSGQVVFVTPVAPAKKLWGSLGPLGCQLKRSDSALPKPSLSVSRQYAEVKGRSPIMIQG